MSKNILLSKTFWFNLLTIILYLLNNHYAWLGIPAEYLPVAIGIINVILRLFTDKKLTIGKGEPV